MYATMTGCGEPVIVIAHEAIGGNRIGEFSALVVSPNNRSGLEHRLTG